MPGGSALIDGEHCKTSRVKRLMLTKVGILPLLIERTAAVAGVNDDGRRMDLGPSEG